MTFDILISVILLFSGTLLLYFGAEGLVSGSSSMAFRMGITPLIIGLTIVAFGTSSPELVVSISAAFNAKSEIALGNVVGSNICNIALILGVAALVRPIKVDIKLIKTDILIMLGASLLLILLIIDGEISRIDGVVLFSGIVIYNWTTIYLAKRTRMQNHEEYDKKLALKKKKTWVDVTLVIGGLLVLVLGANLFLKGAIEIASFLGASEALIGLSIVAFGTSLPELATSMVAAFKDEGDISLGNAIGSNIFNILCVLGAASIIHPITTTGINWIDIGVMLIVAIVVLPLAWSKYKLTRPEGLFLFLIYIGYIYYLYQQLP